jgi:hypothetical protein
MCSGSLISIAQQKEKANNTRRKYVRHDYISIWMNEFACDLAHIAELKKEARWPEVQGLVGKSLKALTGADPTAIATLTDTELLAALVGDGPTFLVPYKLTVLVALLKEAGDFATVQYPPSGGHGWYQTALHLLLDAKAHKELREYSELAPTVELLLSSLGDLPLLAQTRLLLARDYERAGCFDKVKEELLAALKMVPSNPEVLAITISSLQRLNGNSEGALIAGGLSRSELQSTLSELFDRRSVRSTQTDTSP